MSTPLFSPLKLFYCYACKDRVLRDELDIHLIGLKRAQLISSWYDGQIVPGTSWEYVIEEQLNTADIILLLVSPDFMNSDYWFKFGVPSTPGVSNNGLNFLSWSC